MSTSRNQLPLQWQHSRLGIARRRAWHPSTSELMHGERNGMIVSSPIEYRNNLLRAARVVDNIVSNGGHLWVINTSPTLAPLVLSLSNIARDSISYSSHAWTPGTLTNWSTVSRSVLSYGMFKQRCSELLQEDSLEFPRYKRVKRHFQGLISKDGTPAPHPDLIIMLNPGTSPRVIDEAQRMHIPVIGFVESDTSLKGITYPIIINLQNLRDVYKTLTTLLSVVPRK
ncbi:MAG: 30S ribosomal protein S2 [Aliivibrio sp.]|nr:30S ribosomal protein S2 [Aliivibrio sp.]